MPARCGRLLVPGRQQRLHPSPFFRAVVTDDCHDSVDSDDLCSTTTTPSGQLLHVDRTTRGRTSSDTALLYWRFAIANDAAGEQRGHVDGQLEQLLLDVEQAGVGEDVLDGGTQ